MNNENLSEIIEYLEKMHKYVLISRLDVNTFKFYKKNLEIYLPKLPFILETISLSSSIV